MAQGISRLNRRASWGSLLAGLAILAVAAILPGPLAGPGRAQSPILLGGICVEADQMPDRACGCTVDRLLVAGFLPRTVNDLVRGERAPYPTAALQQYDGIVERCVADPEHANRARDRDTGFAPGEPLQPDLPTGTGSPYFMCTRNLSIVGEHCGCMANRARAAGIADPVAARLFSADGSRASDAQISSFEALVRDCSGYPMRIGRAPDGKAAQARPGGERVLPAPATTPRATTPRATTSGGTASRVGATSEIALERLRAGIDPGFRFRASTAYAPEGFFAPLPSQRRILEHKLETCELRVCAEGKGLSAEDFGVVYVDLSQSSVSSHALLLPRQGGNACRRGGCFWLVLSGAGDNWGAIQHEVGFSDYLAVTDVFNGHAVLEEEPDREGKASFYFEVARDQGVYWHVPSRDLIDATARRAAEAFERGFSQAAAPGGPRLAGHGAAVRDHLGRPLPLIDGLPVVNANPGTEYSGPDERVIASIGAEHLRRGDGAGLDYRVKAIDGTSPTLRVERESASLFTFSDIGGGPDLYQLRVYYRADGPGPVGGAIRQRFDDQDPWGEDILLSPAYEPQDGYEWAVGVVPILNPEYSRFGQPDMILREVSVALGPLAGSGPVHVDRIELVAMGYPSGSYRIEPNMP